MAFSKSVLADNLRGLRAKHRMTQEEVAKVVGVSVNTIANYENGEGGMGYETAWKLADLYGVSIGELGGRDERKTA